MTFAQWVEDNYGATHDLTPLELSRMEEVWHAGRGLIVFDTAETLPFRYVLGQHVRWAGGVWVIDQRRFTEGVVSHYVQYLLAPLGKIDATQGLWAYEPDIEEVTDAP